MSPIYGGAIYDAYVAIVLRRGLNCVATVASGLYTARTRRPVHVRVEFLRCPTGSTLRWNVAEPEVRIPAVVITHSS
jgi:hypothetical protein